MTELAVPPVLSARHLVKHFPVRVGALRRHVGDVHAVCDVSLNLAERETLALVGESASGKSTLARLLLNLVRPTSGDVLHHGRVLSELSRRELFALRRQTQPVFGDPADSLDPRLSAFDLIAEPLRVHGWFAYETVHELMDLVGLDPAHGRRRPDAFTDGQRQRIGLARALALRPPVLVLDEPVAALDASARAGVVNLLEDLRASLGLTYLFVTRDLAVARHLADRVAVMYLGRIVEAGTALAVCESPSHPYTQALLSAVPLPDPRKERHRRRILLTGDVPAATDPPSGCRFRTRCPKFARELSTMQRGRCVGEVPELRRRFSGTEVACHYASVSTVL